MKRWSLTPLVLASALLVLPACVAANTSRVDSGPAAGPSGSAQAETYENPNFYYLFDDVLIPNGLEHSTDEDFSFDTQQFKAGIQVFQGRVVFDDLINFFLNNMTKDGWKKVSAVRSKKSILIFEKANKACTIEVVDGFKAKATIFAIEYKSGGGSPAARATKDFRPGTAPAKNLPPVAPQSSFSEKDIN